MSRDDYDVDDEGKSFETNEWVKVGPDHAKGEPVIRNPCAEIGSNPGPWVIWAPITRETPVDEEEKLRKMLKPSMLPHECPCGITRADCTYHK